MAADLVGPEPRHQPDDHRAEYWNQEQEEGASVSDRCRREGKISVPEDIGRESDEPEERPGAECAARAGNDRHGGKDEHSIIGAVIAEAPRMVK
jgi:hypothetical protein